jgi:aspartyl aminopeptidase
MNTNEMTNCEAMGLINFLNASPCNFWAVDTIRGILCANGYTELNMAEPWKGKLKPGARHFVVKNGSAIFAFELGSAVASNPFRIISAHSDSPCFRIKPAPEMRCEGGVVKLNTEVYGGPILYTWFDRPLSIAGRVMLRGADALHPVTRLVRFNEPLLTIPHLAIHFNRAVNEGNHLSKQKDMLPVLGIINDSVNASGTVLRMVADKLQVDVAEILDCDLALYDTTPAQQWGLNKEFISSGRLDDLSMAYAAMRALLLSKASAEQQNMVKVMAIFDNEETGSGTKQGAASPILHNILMRIVEAFDGGFEEYSRAIAESFMVSADNAHAVHPNYVEKYDPTNHPVMGGGPVIKINANCKYMTDADSAAVFRAICEETEVPYQYFVNHSDVAGGSTLGNILTSKIDLRGVDMGAALWAMHSVRETASAVDNTHIIRAFTRFFDC